MDNPLEGKTLNEKQFADVAFMTLAVVAAASETPEGVSPALVEKVKTVLDSAPTGVKISGSLGLLQAGMQMGLL